MVCLPGRFDVLQGHQECFTCTVGMKITKAQYYVEDTNAVLALIQVRLYGRILSSKRADHVSVAFDCYSGHHLLDVYYMTEPSRDWHTCLSKSWRRNESRGIVAMFTFPATHRMQREALTFL